MMKRVIIGILILNFSYVLFGQEIEVKGIYAASSLKKFQNSFGCRIGYNGFVKPKTRIGFSLEYLNNCIPYENRYTRVADTTKTIDKVRPNNHKSVSASVHPELSGYGSFGTKGSTDPVVVGWLNFNIGFKYCFAKKE